MAGDVVSPIRPLDDEAALAWLKAQPGSRTSLRPFQLAEAWSWEQWRVNRRLKQWERDGLIARRGDAISVLLEAASEATGSSVQPFALAREKLLLEAPPKQAKKQPSKALVKQAEKQLPAALAEHAPIALSEAAQEVARRTLAFALGRVWSGIGRAAVGLGIITTGAWIAYTSMRANAWFGHSLTPDPVAGEVYSHLSVAAEIIACLIPTGIRFYFQNGEVWSAVRGWALMAVALVVVFFAAGGFAITNINSGVEARAERQTSDVILAERRLDTLTKSRADECRRRGPECRRLEREEQDAIASLDKARAEVKAGADPQAAALGISSTNLHLVQAGAMVALCLFSGLFISFGAGLIWPR
jgi:hypothetical protein